MKSFILSKSMIIIIAFMLFACSPETTGNPISSPTILPGTVNMIKAESCIDQSIYKILPANDNLLESHILYQAEDPITHEWKIWLYSVKDGSRKMIPYGTSIGIGFLNDHTKFIIMGSDNDQVVLGSTENLSLVNTPIDDALLANFPPYSIRWRLLVLNMESPSYPNAADYQFGKEQSPNGKFYTSWNLGYPAFAWGNNTTGETKTIIETANTDSITGTWNLEGDEYIFAHSWQNDEESDVRYFSQLYIVSADGDYVQPISAPIPNILVQEILLSPDETKVGFTYWQPENPLGLSIGVLSIGEINGFRVGDLCCSLMDRNTVIWSPDNQWLLYIYHSNTSTDLRALNLQNGNVYCITNDDWKENMIDWR